MKLYHGSSDKFTADSNRCLYFTPDINIAKEYALGLDDCGNYNPESYIYEMEIDESLVTEEDDFGYFDSMGFLDYDDMPEITHNTETDYYCVKHPNGLRLVEHYENNL